ncbi:MAG: S8 family serine peptidase [Gemmataceae bacterium]|nr:S8 family serine peptidase [Gemmataceae bacterium]
MNFTIPPDIIRGPESDVLPLASDANWGIEVFGVNDLRKLTSGEGVIAGVVDTGVDRSHPDLANCIAAKDFTGSRYGDRDRNGHGTHVTGTVGATNPNIGMAPGCKTVHGKCLSDGGSGSDSWIAAAIRWAVYEQGAEIISGSLGSSGPSNTINAAMQEVSEKNNVWCVFAAGNSGGNTPDIDWPGRSPWCISVAALNKDLSPASFSSAGAKIDTAFAGVNIWSAKPGGGYQQMSGTSMATPGVSGVLTLLRSALKKAGRPIPPIAELRKLLVQVATDAYTPGRDRRTGPGFVTPILLALNLTRDPLPVQG